MAGRLHSAGPRVEPLDVIPPTRDRAAERGPPYAPGMNAEATTLDIAARLFDCISRGDVEGVRALYDPDVRIWHNFDGVEQTRDQNLQLLGWLATNVKDIRYEEVQCQEVPGGFVQRHVLRGTAANGAKLDIPAAMFGTIKDGKIVRLEEYLDTAQTAALRG